MNFLSALFVISLPSVCHILHQQTISGKKEVQVKRLKAETEIVDVFSE